MTPSTPIFPFLSSLSPFSLTSRSSPYVCGWRGWSRGVRVGGGDGIVGLNASGLTNTIVAVRPGGRGDVTATHRLWIQRPGNSKTCLGAGVIYQGHIYQVNMMGFVECRDLKTGERLWEERLTGTGARNASW